MYDLKKDFRNLNTSEAFPQQAERSGGATSERLGGVFNIAVIPGDGIGPEVTRQSIKVLNAVASKYHHNFNFTYGLMGAAAIAKTGDPLPQQTIDLCHQSDAILFGAIGHPKYDNDASAKV